jgi:large subunit ribosomal protein L23
MSTYFIKPRITEKAYRIAGDGSVRTYTFVVPVALDKETVKKIVEQTYKVSVTDVRTVTTQGKVRRFKGVAGRTSNFKKALVRLKAGETIAAFDQPETGVTE